MNSQFRMIVLLYSFFYMINANAQRVIENFNFDWKFTKGSENNIKDNAKNNSVENFNDASWENVILPHSANIEPRLVNNMWQGICWYRKSFFIDKKHKDKVIFLEFEGAMSIADVYINGELLLTHKGGYSPFSVDISNILKFGEDNVVAIALDNKDNSDVPPGKPIKQLDFSYYGGLYRNIKLVIKDKLHITNAVYANKTASGGILVSYPKIEKTVAEIAVQVHLKNEYDVAKKITIKTTINKNIATKVIDLAAKSDKTEKIILRLNKPKLWSPRNPSLYNLNVEVFENEKLLDNEMLKIGIRSTQISAKGFLINGKKMFMRGTNRHQEYPFIGYALSDNAQFRDALKIKEAGFDMVRLSHYMQAPAFLNACNELGILVIDAIPGWQFYKDGEFAKLTEKNSRDMIRNDRNNPSIILWETSLNETGNMPNEMRKKLHEIVAEELPQQNAYSCGWVDSYYDVFIPARQHGKGPIFWDNWKKDNKAILTAEYGDWEYYANAAANFNQSGAKELKKEEKTSRQLRGDGERRLLQAALNFQESHNQNHRCTSMIGDANWVFADYNRGYSDDLCSSGVVDLFRLPKFAYYFYRSQRSANEETKLFSSGPMVNIASYWNAKSSTDIRIYSNCEEIELFLNKKSLGKKRAIKDAFSDNLKYPPFIFKLKNFKAGELNAIGYLKGKAVANHIVKTAEKPQKIKIEFDLSSKNLKADGADVIFVYGKVIDKNGTLCTNFSDKIEFKVKGNGKIIGENPVKVEAGIATILLQATKSPGEISVNAEGDNISGSAKINSEK